MKPEYCPSNRHEHGLPWEHQWVNATIFRCDPGGELVLTMTSYVETAGTVTEVRQIEVRTGPFTADIEVAGFVGRFLAEGNRLAS